MPSILKFLVVVFLCHCEVNAEKKSCTKFPEVPQPTTLSLLRKKLKCNYDIEVPPLNASNSRLRLQLQMFKNRLEYYGSNEHFTSFSYFLMVWHDERLKWNEDEYKNHSAVYMKTYDIWSPSVVDPGIGYFSHPPYVLVLSTGQVNYLLWWQMNGHCQPTYAKWADKRICTISFQLEPADKLLVRDHYMITDFHEATQYGSWSVVDVTPMKNERISSGKLTDPIPFISKIDTTLGLITLEVHLQRMMVVMDATLFSPAAVLFLMVLASTWIPCNSSIRPALLALTTLLEIFLMHFATRAIPTLPGRFSDFAVLYRDIVMVSGAAFFEWYIAYIVASKKIASSGRLQSVAGRASQSSYAFIRRILLIPSNPPTKIFALEDSETTKYVNTASGRPHSVLFTLIVRKHSPMDGAKTPVQNSTPEGAFLSVILDRITFVILLVIFIIVTILTAHRPTSIE